MSRDLLSTAQWKALQSHHHDVKDLHMRDLFAQDSARFETFSVHGCGMLLDYSKNRITEKTMQLLFDLARATDVAGEAKRMLTGERINSTEDRSVLHTALRLPESAKLQVDGKEVVGLSLIHI